MGYSEPGYSQQGYPNLKEKEKKGFCMNDIDSVERIDANRSQKLGLNDANRARKLGQNDENRGRKSSKWCKFRLVITENRAEMMQIGPNFAPMSPKTLRGAQWIVGTALTLPNLTLSIDGHHMSA